MEYHRTLYYEKVGDGVSFQVNCTVRYNSNNDELVYVTRSWTNQRLVTSIRKAVDKMIAVGVMDDLKADGVL